MKKAILRRKIVANGRPGTGPVAGVCAVVLLAVVCHPVRADLAEQEQAAFQAAVGRVAPAVVRIETVGGLERVEHLLAGTGPTTGLVVDPAGYILSSAFNFFNQPTSILVRLPDGSRRPAQVVATDHSRMLVLLKIDPPGPLPVPEFAPADSPRVGQWTIAVGRTFEAGQPNLAVGVLSAVNRVWGKALQTDAPVSPNNYGGPLVDIQGRVLGLLVPLSPQEESDVSGVEWYDSGIGFAVPAEQLQAIIPRLKTGTDLRGGLLGISFRSRNLHMESPVIKASYPRSPAREAGLVAGDRIVEIDGRPTARAANVKQAITRHYAGDTLRMVIDRDGTRIERELTLVAELSPFQQPVLGILPMRPVGDQQPDGIRVRWVEPGSPAARAGIRAGDVLHALDATDTPDDADLRRLLLAAEPEQEVKVKLTRGEQELTLTAKLGVPSESLPPAELPPAHEPLEAKKKKKGLKVGVFQEKIPQSDSEARVYVPEGYRDAVPHGLVLWLHEPGAKDFDALLARWKPLCQRHDLILLVPHAGEVSGWKPGDRAGLRALLIAIAQRYEIDPWRVAVVAAPGSATAALEAAFVMRDTIRAAAAIDAVRLGDVPPADPVHGLSFYLGRSEHPKLRPLVDRTVEGLRKQNYPVLLQPLAESQSLDEPQLARWIDMLDKI